MQNACLFSQTPCLKFRPSIWAVCCFHSPCGFSREVGASPYSISLNRMLWAASCLLALSSGHTVWAETLQVIPVDLGCFCTRSIFFPRVLLVHRIIHFNSRYSKSYPESCRPSGRQIFMLNYFNLVIKKFNATLLCEELLSFGSCLHQGFKVCVISFLHAHFYLLSLLELEKCCPNCIYFL